MYEYSALKMETIFPVEMPVSIILHTEDYKMNDLGVISNYIKLGTVSVVSVMKLDVRKGI